MTKMQMVKAYHVKKQANDSFRTEKCLQVCTNSEIYKIHNFSKPLHYLIMSSTVCYQPVSYTHLTLPTILRV